VTVNETILLVAGIFLALSIFYMSGDMTRFSAFQRQARVSFAWLCAALATTLVVFSFFPTTGMSGQAFGFSLTGAAAFVLVILLAAPSLQRKISDLDQTDSVRSSPPSVNAPKYLVAQEIYRYSLDGTEERSLCIITSNLNRVIGVDVWVNSENTSMRMSERYHQTISGMIRFYGAERDPGGHIVKDLIADELAEKVAGKTPVQPAVAISTGSGKLRETNGVRAIVHVAAVQIEEDMGRRQLQEIDTCVFNVLHEIDRIAAGLEPSIRSVIFPLFGTGSGQGERDSTARVMVDSAAAYLRQKQDSCLREIYFTARTNLTLDVFREAFEECPGLRLQKESARKSRGRK
jgi:O-acetyl-ADP-ribose deacetylase (regulator of RNase III)